MEQLEDQVWLAHQAAEAPLGQQDQLAIQEVKDFQARLDLRDLMASEAIQVTQVMRAHLDWQVQVVKMALLEHLEWLEHLDYLAHLDLLVVKDQGE